MIDFLAEAVAARPDAVAADDGAHRWSFADLDTMAAAAAAALRGLGAGPDRTVVIEGDPSLALLAALHGAFRTGALVAPLNPRLTATERDAALAVLRPTVVLDDATLAGLGPDLLQATDAAAAALAWTDALAASPASRSASRSASPAGPSPRAATAAPGAAHEVAREPAASVLWTSGTSGTPRGVLLTEAGLRASAEASRRHLKLGPDDVWYASLSPAHVGGLALLTRAAILGSRVALRGRFSTAELDALIESGAVTHASLVPTMLLRLLDHRDGRPPPATLRLILLGGASTPRALLERALADGYPIGLTYGLTEATSQVATAPPDRVRRAPDTALPPLPGVELRIAASGEIEVRGPTVSPGLITGQPLAGADGWLATGDLGTLDDRGDLRVLGRRSSRIVSGGVTVDAHEVEAALVEHPGVAAACVVGLADESWGERVAALIVPSRAAPLDLEALQRWVDERLSAAKRPRTIRAVEALPLNANGKVDPVTVRALLASPGLP